MSLSAEQSNGLNDIIARMEADLYTTTNTVGVLREFKTLDLDKRKLEIEYVANHFRNGEYNVTVTQRESDGVHVMRVEKADDFYRVRK